MERTGARSVFADSKPVLSVIFIAVIVCVLGYFVGTGYANGNYNIGTAKHISNLNAASDSDGSVQWQIVQMRVTAYCPCPKCCGSYSDGITASGHKISQGDRFVAADRMYPFGTEMVIPGYEGSNEAVKVLDRGGVIRGNCLDVFFNTHQEALEWGVRYLDVKISYQ